MGRIIERGKGIVVWIKFGAKSLALLLEWSGVPKFRGKLIGWVFGRQCRMGSRNSTIRLVLG